MQLVTCNGALYLEVWAPWAKAFQLRPPRMTTSLWRTSIPALEKDQSSGRIQSHLVAPTRPPRANKDLRAANTGVSTRFPPSSLSNISSNCKTYAPEEASQKTIRLSTSNENSTKLVDPGTICSNSSRRVFTWLLPRDLKRHLGRLPGQRDIVDNSHVF